MALDRSDFFIEPVDEAPEENEALATKEVENEDQEGIDSSDFFVEEQEDPKDKLVGLREEVRDLSPNKAKVVEKIAGETGIPWRYVKKDPEFWAKHIEDKKFKEQPFHPSVSEYFKKNPLAIQQFENIEDFNQFAQIFDTLGRALDQGKLIERVGDLGHKSLSGKATKAEEFELAIAYKMMARDYLEGSDVKDYPIVFKAPHFAAESLPITLRALETGGKAGVAAGVAAYAAAKILPPTRPFASKIAKTAFRLAAAGGAGYETYRFESGLAYVEYRDLVDDEGNLIDNDVAIGVAQVVGVVNGSLELLPLTVLVKGIKGALGKPTKKYLLKGMSKEAIKKLLKDKTKRKIYGPIFKSIAANSVAEGGTEWLQEFSLIAGREFTQALTGGEILDLEGLLDRVWTKENIAQLNDAGVKGSLGSGFRTATIESAISPVAVLNKRIQVKRAQKQIENFDKAVEFGKENFKGDAAVTAVDVATNQKSTGEVFLPIKEFDEYWQEKDIDPREGAKQVLGEENIHEYDEAKKTGKDIRVEKNAYIGSAINSDFHDNLRDKIRHGSEEAMNEVETKEAIKQFEEIKKEVDKFNEDPENIKLDQEEAKIRNDIIRSLGKIGQVGRAAKDSAKVAARAFTLAAKRAGITDIAKAWKDYKFKIHGAKQYQQRSGKKIGKLEKFKARITGAEKKRNALIAELSKRETEVAQIKQQQEGVLKLKDPLDLSEADLALAATQKDRLGVLEAEIANLKPQIEALGTEIQTDVKNYDAPDEFFQDDKDSDWREFSATLSTSYEELKSWKMLDKIPKEDKGDLSKTLAYLEKQGVDESEIEFLKNVVKISNKDITPGIRSVGKLSEFDLNKRSLQGIIKNFYSRIAVRELIIRKSKTNLKLDIEGFSFTKKEDSESLSYNSLYHGDLKFEYLHKNQDYSRRKLFFFPKTEPVGTVTFDVGLEFKKITSIKDRGKPKRILSLRVILDDMSIKEDIFGLKNSSMTPFLLEQIVKHAVNNNIQKIYISNYNAKEFGAEQIESFLKKHGATNISDRKEGAKTKYEFEITDSMVDSVRDKANKEFFQDDPTKGKRGSYIPGKVPIINLFENADRSTFIHEFGHYYLDLMEKLSNEPNASPEFIKQHEKVRKWLGAGPEQELTREQHEKFTAAFEDYMASGKAPSQNLLEVFRHFKNWMLQIYKGKIQSDEPLSPEIESFFSWMLATDEEVNAMKLDDTKLMDDTDFINMNPDKALEYNKAIHNAREEVKEKLLAKYIKILESQKRSERNAVYKKIKARILEELKKDRIYSIKANIINRTDVEGKPLPENSISFVMSYDSLLAQGLTKTEINNLPKNMYTKEGGTDASMVLSLTGYGTVKELANDLLDARTMDAVASDRAAKEAKDVLDPDMTPEELKDEVTEMYHNENKEKALRMELAVLISKDFAVFKGLDKRLDRRIPPQSLFREQAIAILENIRIKDLRPHLFFIQQQKLAKLSREALLKGDIALAFDLKKKELLYFQLYKQSRAMEKKAKRAKAKIDTFGTIKKRFDKRKKAGKSGKKFYDQIEEILSKYGLIEEKINAEEPIADFQKAQKERGIPLNLNEATVTKRSRINWLDLTFNELLDITDDITALEKLANIEKKFLSSEEKLELDEAADEAVRILKDTGVITEKDFHEASNVVEGKDVTPTLTSNWWEAVKRGSKYLVRPEHLAMSMDRLVFNGFFYRRIILPIQKASKAKDKYTALIKKTFNGLLDKHYTSRERKNWLIEKLDFSDIGVKIKMSKLNLLVIAMNIGNKGNKKALLEGHGWTEEQLQSMIDTLDKRDWDFVQGVWDMLDGLFWTDIEKMELELTGVIPERVEAQSIETKFGTYKGGYYPIMYNRRITDVFHALKEPDGDVLLSLQQNQPYRAMTRKYHLIERTGETAGPVSLQLFDLANHMDMVAHDLAYRKAIIDVQKFLYHPKVKAAITASFGTEGAWTQLKNWIHNVAGENFNNLNEGGYSFLRAAKKGVVIKYMAFKVSVAFSQLAGIFPAIEKVGFIRFGKAWSQTVGKMFVTGSIEKSRIAEAWNDSTKIKNRFGTFERDAKDFFQGSKVPRVYGRFQYFLESLKIKEIQQSGLKFVGLFDLFVSIPTFIAAKDLALEGKVPGVTSLEDAIDYAENAVRNTQSSGEEKDLAAIQRGGDIGRILTIFLTFFNLVYNEHNARLKESYLILARDKGPLQQRVKDVISLMLPFFIFFSILPILYERKVRGRDEEDEDSLALSYGYDIATYPLLGVPGIRTLVGSIGREYNDKSFSPVIKEISRIADAGIHGLKAGKGDVDFDGIKVLKLMLETGSVPAGLPYNQAKLTIEYINAVMTGEHEPETKLKACYEAFVTGTPRE